MDKLEDIIYLAGYTDGDGCFSISSGKKRVTASFIISSTNLDIINHLVSTYGGTLNSYIVKNSKQKPVYSFRKERRAAKEFCEKLLPHLVQRKNECLLFLSYFNKTCKKEKLELVKQMKIRHKELDLISIEDIEKLKQVNQITPTREDFIYMAGFIDAECNFTISKYKPKNAPNFVYKTILQLNDTKSPMFYWIKSRFGGFCNFVKRPEGLKNQITWRLGAKALFPFLKEIVPYLRYKKPVAEKLIEFYKTTLTNGGARHTEAFRESYAQIISEREAIIQQVHLLNKKGL